MSEDVASGIKNEGNTREPFKGTVRQKLRGVKLSLIKKRLLSIKNQVPTYNITLVRTLNIVFAENFYQLK